MGPAGGSDRLLWLGQEQGRGRARRLACVVQVGPTEGLRDYGDTDWRLVPDGPSRDQQGGRPRHQLRAEVAGSQTRKEAQ